MARHRGEGTIYRRKDGRYEAALYVTTSSGLRKRIRLYAASRVEAEEKLVAARRQEAQGLPVSERPWRLASYLDYWLSIVKHKNRPNTYLDYETVSRRYLKPGIGNRYLPKLGVAELQRFFDRQIAAGMSLQIVQKQRRVLSSALARAQREELVLRNVARLVELPAAERRDITPWSPAQVAQFLTAAANDPLYPAFVLLAVYGLRRGEVLGLRWEDIDFEKGVIRIRYQMQRYDGELHLAPTKTRSSRRDLPLVPLARTVLTEHRAKQVNQVLVFATSSGKPIEGRRLWRTFKQVVQSTDLPLATVHHLRHAAATLLKDVGVPARDAQVILGHSDINTTQQIYQHGDWTGQLRGLQQIERQLSPYARDSSYSRREQPSRAVADNLTDSADSGARGSLVPPSFVFGGSNPSSPANKIDRPFSSPTSLAEVYTLAERRLWLYVLGATAVIYSRQKDGA